MKTIVLIFALAAAAPAYATPLYPSGREAGDVVDELRRNPHQDPDTLRDVLWNGHARPYNEPRYMPPRVTRFGTPFYQELPHYVRPRVTHFGSPSYQTPFPAPSYTPPPVTHFVTPEFSAPSFTPSYMPPPVTNYGTPFYQALP